MSYKRHIGPALGAFLFWLPATIAALMYFEDQPSVTHAQRVLNSPTPGEDLLLEYDVERRPRSGCHLLITPFIFDGQNLRHEFRTFETSMPLQGGREILKAKVRVPTAANPGSAVYRPIIRYHCNIIQRWWPRDYEVEDLTFTISE